MTVKLLVIWFALMLGLGLVGRWHSAASLAGRCRLDGTRITPVHQVDLLHDGTVLVSFCCVRCAQEWPDVPAGAYWQVRDEVTGEPIDASRACFVESSIVTVPSRGDRTHVFRSWADAMTHANAYDGRRIENPLRSTTETPALPPSRPAPP